MNIFPYPKDIVHKVLAAPPTLVFRNFFITAQTRMKFNLLISRHLCSDQMPSSPIFQHSSGYPYSLFEFVNQRCWLISLLHQNPKQLGSKAAHLGNCLFPLAWSHSHVSCFSLLFIPVYTIRRTRSRIPSVPDPSVGSRMCGNRNTGWLAVRKGTTSGIVTVLSTMQQSAIPMLQLAQYNIITNTTNSNNNRNYSTELIWC